MKKVFTIAILLFCVNLFSQFTYSGYIKSADGSGVINYPVKIYKRTTPVMTGFTSQNNYNGHSYYRSTGSMTWTNARTACANMGGHLVTVTTAAENSFIFGLWPSGWIGLTDELVEGTWRWVTGEAYSYQSWNGGEPNNSGNEDYIQFVSGGKWNDLNNNSSLPYVLEFEYIVDYTPWVLVNTVYTDATGRYVINEPTNPSIEWYIQLDIPSPVTQIQLIDVTAPAQYIIGSYIKKSFHWSQYDVNLDGNITVSDMYKINKKRVGSIASLPAIYLYTAAQWNTLASGITDLRSTVLGSSSITINSPVSGTTTGNYYIILPGYKGQITF